MDLTPTWEQAARIMCMVMEAGTLEGKEMAKEQIMDMGRMLDRVKAQQDAAKT